MRSRSIRQDFSGGSLTFNNDSVIKHAAIHFSDRIVPSPFPNLGQNVIDCFAVGYNLVGQSLFLYKQHLVLR